MSKGTSLVFAHMFENVGCGCDDETMTGEHDKDHDSQDDRRGARETVADARRDAAKAQARLAEAALRYADLRRAEDTAAADQRNRGKPGRARPAEFVADELSVMLRDQPYQIRCLLARSRRVAAGLPTVWDGFRRGDLDAEQVRIIDRVARRVTEATTLAAIDEQVIDAAQTKTPKQLQVWLLRLVVQLEPLAFEERHRRALTDRRVTVVQGADGIGYVTGEVSAADAAAIDAMLAAAARSLGADDPRTEHQRRADLFADLLLGRLTFDDTTDNDHDGTASDQSDNDEVGTDESDNDGGSNGGGGSDNERGSDGGGGSDNDSAAHEADVSEWLEVEIIDPDTGELLGTQLQRVDADGQPIGEPLDPVTHRPFGQSPRLIRRPRTIRIGVVVPLSSLLGATEMPAELADRSGFIPGQTLRQHIAEALDTNSSTEVLFTRLLTDDGGRLLDTTELGRHASTRLAEAIKIRAGTCRFPTCTVPADRCDLDHHQPHPHGPTSATNEDPFCRRHHRGKTFAWLACTRNDNGVDWTLPDAEHHRCLDEPLPTAIS